jgi:hypothetical protein
MPRDRRLINEGVVRVRSFPVPLRKESKRGLLALAVLCIVGLATFASVASSGASSGALWGGGRGKDSVAARLLHAR